MARLPEGKQRVCFGCYYTMSPANKGLAINMSLTIRWYGIPFLMWKVAHEDCNIRWYQYPLLINAITRNTFLSLLGKLDLSRKNNRK